jgi:hypothetical protein
MKLIMSSIQSLKPSPLTKVDALEIERDNEMEPHRRGRNGRLTLNAAQHLGSKSALAMMHESKALFGMAC